MLPHIDLAIVFRASSGKLSKQQAREDSQQAEQQYRNLLHRLRNAGLQASGRRGEKQGHVLVLVGCPLETLAHLVHRERYSDFLSGLPITNKRAMTDEMGTLLNVSAADRLRLVHAYVTGNLPDGGLGIGPGSSIWSRVVSVTALHDHAWNESWIWQWTHHVIDQVQFDLVRDQFGEAVALYFSFLHTYTTFLIFPSVLGVIFYFFGTPYSAIYSVLLLLWSVVFVEFWRVRERVLSVRWGTRGSFRVEKRRAAYAAGFPWWKRELRMLASVPLLLMFAGILAALLTGIFVLEAFVTHLYTGPGQHFVSLAPTILFVALVPRLMGVYQSFLTGCTNWENHSHQSTHDASLTIKTFSLSAVVAYLGLALSAFVYVPFGEPIMELVHKYVLKTPYFPGNGNAKSEDRFWERPISLMTRNERQKIERWQEKTFWETDFASARNKLDASRLQNQMFAYTVTNQAVNTFLEIGLPFLLRAVDAWRNGQPLSGAFANAKPAKPKQKKRVAFEDETLTSAAASASGGDGGKEEREYLECLRREVALPDYQLFGDFSEMVTQFGYVVLWSSIWPLAPVMALINNWLEIRSDAYKITVHNRRPIPSRTDTIGPWLESLTFITWLGALTNSALVYLFRPRPETNNHDTEFIHIHPTTSRALHTDPNDLQPTRGELILTAALIALAASHGFIILRAAVRHVVERAVWKGSKELEEVEKAETEVKGKYLGTLGMTKELPRDVQDSFQQVNGLVHSFWQDDEGVEEIRRAVKDN